MASLPALGARFIEVTATDVGDFRQVLFAVTGREASAALVCPSGAMWFGGMDRGIPTFWGHPLGSRLYIRRGLLGFDPLPILSWRHVETAGRICGDGDALETDRAGRPSRYHIVRATTSDDLDAWPACGRVALLDREDLTLAANVPGELRCRGAGCRGRWPGEAGHA